MDQNENRVDGADRSAAFTLVELLVVITIMSVLIALLLPSLSAAKEAARGIRCLSNERQIGVAIAAYTNEDQEWWPVGVYPFCGHGYHDSPLWAAVVAHWGNNPYITEYLTNDHSFAGGAFGGIGLGFDEAKWLGYSNTPKPHQGILKCPSETFMDAWGSDMAVSYGYNCAQYGLGTSDAYTLDPSVGGGPGGAFQPLFGRIQTPSLVQPATTAMVYDVEQPGNDEYQVNWNLGGVPALGTYHAGETANVLWTDGHAVTRKADSLTANDFDRRY